MTFNSIWFERHTENIDGRSEGDKREFVLSADQRRVSLKFLSFIFVHYGANYAWKAHTPLYFDKTLIILSSFPPLFPSFTLVSLHQLIRVSVHVHLCAVGSQLLVCLIICEVSAFAFCLCLSVCVCVFSKEIKAWIELVFCADNLTSLYIRYRKLWSLGSRHCVFVCMCVLLCLCAQCSSKKNKTTVSEVLNRVGSLSAVIWMSSCCELTKPTTSNSFSCIVGI